MESNIIQRNRKRIKRAGVNRHKLRGSQDKPRLSVMKSNLHIGVQLIDDEKGVTLASASTVMKKFKSKSLGNNKAAAKLIGTEIGALAKDKNITTVVFDRGHHRYHGVIAELANAAREAGLKF